MMGTISSKLSKQELATIFNPKNHLAASERIIENVSTLVFHITKKDVNAVGEI